MYISPSLNNPVLIIQATWGYHLFFSFKRHQNGPLSLSQPWPCTIKFNNEKRSSNWHHKIFFLIFFFSFSVVALFLFWPLQGSVFVIVWIYEDEVLLVSHYKNPHQQPKPASLSILRIVSSFYPASIAPSNQGNGNSTSCLYTPAVTVCVWCCCQQLFLNMFFRCLPLEHEMNSRPGLSNLFSVHKLSCCGSGGLQNSPMGVIQKRSPTHVVL